MAAIIGMLGKKMWDKGNDNEDRVKDLEARLEKKDQEKDDPLTNMMATQAEKRRKKANYRAMSTVLDEETVG